MRGETGLDSPTVQQEDVNLQRDTRGVWLHNLVWSQIDAGAISPPTSSRAKKAGLVELLNLGTDGPEYPSTVMATTNGEASPAADSRSMSPLACSAANGSANRCRMSTPYLPAK